MIIETFPTLYFLQFFCDGSSSNRLSNSKPGNGWLGPSQKQSVTNTSSQRNASEQKEWLGSFQLAELELRSALEYVFRSHHVNKGAHVSGKCPAVCHV